MLFFCRLIWFQPPHSLTSCIGRCTCYTENKDYERGKEGAVIAAMGGLLEPNKTTEKIVGQSYSTPFGSTASKQNLLLFIQIYSMSRLLKSLSKSKFIYTYTIIL
jgi:hypothetical protein